MCCPKRETHHSVGWCEEYTRGAPRLSIRYSARNSLSAEAESSGTDTEPEGKEGCSAAGAPPARASRRLRGGYSRGVCSPSKCNEGRTGEDLRNARTGAPVARWIPGLVRSGNSRVTTRSRRKEVPSRQERLRPRRTIVKEESIVRDEDRDHQEHLVIEG